MSVLKVKNGNQWDIVPAIKGDPGDPAADESITDDMLVTDGIKTEIEWLWGNQLTDSREGEILHAEDAYEAPLVSLDVDGKSTQATTTGKNLFDKDTAYAGWYINSSGIRANGSTNSCTDFIPVVGGNTYAFSYGAALSAGNYIAWYTDADQSTVTGNRVDARNLQNIVATAPSDAKYVRFSFQTSSLNKIQLETGSSATAYEPYTGAKPSPSPDYPQEITSIDEPSMTFAGKNILNIESSGSWRHAGLTVSVQNGVVTRSGIHTNIPSPNSRAFTIGNGIVSTDTGTNYVGQTTISSSVAMPIKRGTYKYSCEGNTSPFRVILKYGQIGTTGTNVSSGNVFAINDDCYYCLGVQINTYETDATYTVYPQLELGSTATDYEPYLGNTVPLLPDGYSLRSLPDGTKDELHLSYLRPSKREGWAWYSRELVKRIQERILNGSENWNRGSSTYDGTLGTDRFINLSDSLDLGIRSPNSVLSPILKSKNDYIWANPNVHLWSICRNAKQVHVVFDNETVGIDSSGEDDRTNKIKTWLSENPITIYYPLATPITETLDPIELPIMPSRTINVWSDPATNLKMTYIQDSNLIIENLEATIADIATS